MLEVSIYEDDERVRVLTFEEGTRIRFGRSADNQIVLSHNSISRPIANSPSTPAAGG